MKSWGQRAEWQLDKREWSEVVDEEWEKKFIYHTTVNIASSHCAIIPLHD